MQPIRQRHTKTNQAYGDDEVERNGKMYVHEDIEQNKQPMLHKIEQNGTGNASSQTNHNGDSPSLIVFGLNLSSYSRTVQFLFLMAGLILFMCLYGYYQELVIYGWFNRKLSIFSTFCHFLGCSFFAVIQRYFIILKHNSDDDEETIRNNRRKETKHGIKDSNNISNNNINENSSNSNSNNNSVSDQQQQQIIEGEEDFLLNDADDEDRDYVVGGNGNIHEVGLSLLNQQSLKNKFSNNNNISDLDSCSGYTTASSTNSSSYLENGTIKSFDKEYNITSSSNNNGDSNSSNNTSVFNSITAMVPSSSSLNRNPSTTTTKQHQQLLLLQQHNKRINWFSITMGTAPTHIAIKFYILKLILKTLTQILSNYSMSRINYPAKVLFKSANPVITMIIGIIVFRKKYEWKDYAVVFLLLCGLYIFITTDSKTSPEGTNIGICLVLLSMFFGASLPMIQEYLMLTYQATTEELLYFSFLGSTGISFLLSILAGEFIQGFQFLYSQGNIRIWFIFICFCSVGFFGANFSTKLTQQFGSLVNGIANTVRKAVTLGLSFALFPERNVLTIHHIIGASIFMSGLLLRIIFKEEKQQHHHQTTQKQVTVVSTASIPMSWTHLVNKEDVTMNSTSSSIFTASSSIVSYLRNAYHYIHHQYIRPVLYRMKSRLIVKPNRSGEFSDVMEV